MFLLVASGYFYLFVSLLNFIIVLFEKTSTVAKDKSVIRAVISAVIFIIQSLMKLVLAIESRKRELKADRQAYDWGFGAELISALYLLEKISLGNYQNFKQRLTASHPRTTLRIAHLENQVLSGYDERIERFENEDEYYETIELLHSRGDREL